MSFRRPAAILVRKPGDLATMPLVISRIGELHFRICRKESRYVQLETRDELADGIGGAGYAPKV